MESLFDILNSLIKNGKISKETIIIAARISKDTLEQYLSGNTRSLECGDISYLDELTMQLGPGRELVSNDERVKGILESLIDCYNYKIPELSRLFDVDEAVIRDVLAGKEVDLYVKYILSVSAAHLFYVLKRTYTTPRGSAQKHFHTDAPTGRRCESAFALLSHRESNEEVASTGQVW